MELPSCAAALQLVESRRYFQCGHCGTFGFPEGGVDGIRVIGTTPAAAAMPCMHRHHGARVVGNNHPINLCSKCRGILLPKPSSQRSSANVVRGPPHWRREPLPLDRIESPRGISHVQDAARLSTPIPRYGPGNVVMTTALSRDLIWLDFGEMRQIVDAPAAIAAAVRSSRCARRAFWVGRRLERTNGDPRDGTIRHPAARRSVRRASRSRSPRATTQHQ